METCRAALVSGARGDARSHGHLYHPHFHVLLIVPAEYFEPGCLLCIGQPEWRLMWEQWLRADGRRIVDIRVTENSGEVTKYVTKPGAYLKLDDAGAWWCDPERLETLHYALGSRRVIGWSRSLSGIRRKLGFVEVEDFDDLVAVDEFDDGKAWVPFQVVLYRWRRNEEGRVAYHLWMIKPIMGLDPDECDHEENWWDWEEGQDHERRLH